MATEIFDSVSELYETAIENYKKIGKSCLEVSEQLLQEQIELTSSLLEAAKSKAGKVAAAKDYASFAANQAELGQECIQRILKTSQSCAEIVAEAGKFYQDLFEAGVKSANSNFGTSAVKGKGRKSA
jgi:hypothetical protein